MDEQLGVIKRKKLSPIVKWAGGKEQELKYIIPNLPTNFKRYFEPFVGGGAVYTAVQAEEYLINDKSEELISLYKNIAKSRNESFKSALNEMIHNWNLLTNVTTTNSTFFTKLYRSFANEEINKQDLENRLYEFILKHAEQFNGMFSINFNFNIENFLRELKINLVRKISRMKKIEAIKGKMNDTDVLQNIETALKSAFYMHFRHIYNNERKYKINSEFKSAIFLFIRNFAYSGMFRYNSQGDFNVPYGGMGYNRKNFAKKIEYLLSKELKKRLASTVIDCLDFEDFFRKNRPASDDFIFLDPPYDSEFSSYAKNTFDKNDHCRLSTYLTEECRAQWMLVIKNTDFIASLYADKGLNIMAFDKTYLVSFMNRNEGVN
ncbi:MAG: adenine methylase (dam) [Flavipsychrobacter sp.]|jgi:DNA adenine methylase|nr:adenine methylase (dam) [Flavipsychrobacter sp.]